jgi:transcriptional regulator with XRE-family HTH domain
MDVGKRVREIRNERSLSQDALAKRADVARTTVARLEAGEVSPTVSMLEKLANALGVEPEELIRDPLGVA